MRRALSFALAGWLLAMGLLGVARAEPLDDATAAYQSQDFATAITLLRPLADQGVADAQLKLGTMYAKGEGVPRDLSKAVVLWGQAGHQGKMEADIRLASYFLSGHASSQDYGVVAEACHRLADRSDVTGNRCLGFMYSHGYGVPQDAVQGTTWFRKAAAQGDLQSMDALGSIYQLAEGVAADYGQASFWFGKAADLGDPWAMVNLASMAIQGQGGPQDYVQARVWLDLSALRIPQGNTNLAPAISQLRAITDVHLTSDQLATAGKLTAAWVSDHPKVSGPMHVIVRPNLRSAPTPQQMMAAYPPQAAAQRLAGQVRLECIVTAGGQLANCVVGSESPSEHGFGEAALSLAPYFTMIPQTMDGTPVGGGKVTIPLNFAPR